MGNCNSSNEAAIEAMQADWEAVLFEAKCDKAATQFDTRCDTLVQQCRDDEAHQRKVQRLRQRYSDFFLESNTFLAK